MLSPGDPAPWFSARSSASPTHLFDLAAGQYMVLCFFGSAGHPAARRVLDDIVRSGDRLAAMNAGFCGVSADPEDERLERVCPGPRTVFFWDFDLAVSRLYGATASQGPQYAPHTLVLDPALRVIAALPFDQNIESHVDRVFQVLGQLPPLSQLTGFAPVLTVPYVFEPQFCRTLIDLYERHGGRELGTLSEVDGKTVRVHDHSFKRRADYEITDPVLMHAIRSRIERRVVPEIRKTFHFSASYIERYVVACYDGQSGGHFRPHRDDSTKGSAHRRFAATINLNSADYEGGDLRFPEFGCRTYRAPTGGAIVFSCSLLHEVRPVTRGKRYAFLPFLYDDAAARIREENQQFLSADLRGKEAASPALI
jgi:predicted 2-oxoglutarate/Fe(II)-dependent dioxygenase YbiX/peroxiredoxin